jgi:hypothetical protein
MAWRGSSATNNPHPLANVAFADLSGMPHSTVDAGISNADHLKHS